MPWCAARCTLYMYKYLVQYVNHKVSKYSTLVYYPISTLQVRTMLVALLCSLEELLSYSYSPIPVGALCIVPRSPPSVPRNFCPAIAGVPAGQHLSVGGPPPILETRQSAFFWQTRSAALWQTKSRIEPNP